MQGASGRESWTAKGSSRQELPDSEDSVIQTSCLGQQGAAADAPAEAGHKVGRELGGEL